ncbi:MAG: type 2 isopentenyl-diphosphate Delta-isomerase [Peptoniphilaceae bacterium]|nr:type 2 isopentenyl-diphosphate Delta-isomerase [Peptoniphilaceae bacterium]MDY6018379.1 type 2 isopentenyl-diphosphate Delta-isomerase [Anaerococcus sp.]
MDEVRRKRKDEHIENYLKSEYRSKTLLDQVYLEHNALSQVNYDKIDTSIEFLGKTISMPLMINAMTGGGETSEDINTDLSNICQDFNIPMAVGSEALALVDPITRPSFEIIKEHDDIVRIGNLGYNHSIEDFNFAKDLIRADAMQVHLNIAQELVMDEGDRDFSNTLENIKTVAKYLDVPLIAKEVGFGISKEVAQTLIDQGLKYIDVAGMGGTSFIEIEDLRNLDTDFSDLYEWGIPTAKAIIDVRSLSDDIFIIGSGGIRTALDIAKAIAIGADMCAISGEVLSYLMRGGYDYTLDYLKDLNHKLKIVMGLLGVKNIEELKKVPYKLTGKLKELIE